MKELLSNRKPTENQPLICWLRNLFSLFGVHSLGSILRKPQKKCPSSMPLCCTPHAKPAFASTCSAMPAAEGTTTWRKATRFTGVTTQKRCPERNPPKTKSLRKYAKRVIPTDLSGQLDLAGTKSPLKASEEVSLDKRSPASQSVFLCNLRPPQATEPG